MTQTKQEKQRTYWRAWYARNKEKQREYGRAWRTANPARCRAYEKKQRTNPTHRRRKRYRELYGITPEFKAAMVSAQGNCCAICMEDLSGNSRRQHLDHCHTSGTVRAVLCPPCNITLGLVKDNPTTLRAMADYLEHHQTKKSPEL